jgi:hypothetical protein
MFTLQNNLGNLVLNSKVLALVSELKLSSLLNLSVPTEYVEIQNNQINHSMESDLDIIRNILVKKYDDVQIYKLNPSINDLINNNLYKLYVDDDLYLVPLWHNESYFDGSGCEIIVICEPELPEEIQLDDNNNLYIEKKINAHTELPNMILHSNENKLEIEIGNKILLISLSDLYIKNEQYFTFKNAGISKVKKNLYDVEDKSDIIVKISII